MNTKFVIFALYFYSLTVSALGCDISEEFTEQQSDYFQDQVLIVVEQTESKQKNISIFAPVRIYDPVRNGWYLNDGLAMIDRQTQNEMFSFVIILQGKKAMSQSVSSFSLDVSLISDLKVHLGYYPENATQSSCGFGLTYRVDYQ